MDQLALTTAGSVDDGKSTLVGRLLHESGTVPLDQMDAVTRTSRRLGQDQVNLALLTDGLRAEREQGITIDVAYRYFRTTRRNFILADVPGHVQYTRNMACAASVADLGVVLVDARTGPTEQTWRHISLLSLFAVSNLVLAVNKMDLVDYSPRVFDRVRSTCTEFADRLPVHDLSFIPTCALHGDNVTVRSPRLAWYDGNTLLDHLEGAKVAVRRDLGGARLPVQYVIRPRRDDVHDYRGYAGQMAGGVLRAGDEVVVLPAGQHTRIAAVDGPRGPVPAAFPPMSVTVRLADDLDVGRGDMICHRYDTPPVRDRIDAVVCWMDSRPMTGQDRLLVQHTSRCVPAVVDRIDYRIDVNTLHRQRADHLRINDIGQARLRTAQPVICDDYSRNRTTGRFILVDPVTNRTVACGLITPDGPVWPDRDPGA